MALRVSHAAGRGGPVPARGEARGGECLPRPAAGSSSHSHWTSAAPLTPVRSWLLGLSCSAKLFLLLGGRLRPHTSPNNGHHLGYLCISNALPRMSGPARGGASVISSSCVPTGQHRARQAGSCKGCHGMGPGHRWVGAEGVTTPCGWPGPAPHAAVWRRALCLTWPGLGSMDGQTAHPFRPHVLGVCSV